MIFVIDDDEVMARCVAGYCMDEMQDASVMIFSDAIRAMQTLDEIGVPDLIFLDILLNGPDGFTFLNELVSFSDTARIPVVITTSLDVGNINLADYNVVGILEKDKMWPEDVRRFCKKYAK